MARYYKITPAWAEKLGEAGSAPKHPDGLHLVTEGIKNKLTAYLEEKEGVKLLPDEAFAYIGAIPLTIQEAHASERGELRHDAAAADEETGPMAEAPADEEGASEESQHEDAADNADDTGNDENA